ncbi:uncharacterized protein [Spinacia oleracea]|uniref:CCHC-type domain-containing protein n=1 Tax=Spinacia oleracea TaxID=3562 RepID=A0ABM3R1B1_SPIOL|nr:uncharacterized protein LOC130464058 [Spinacia oleracea]
MMIGLFFTSERLGGFVKELIDIALVLNSLHRDYERFKMHYLFNQKENTFSELMEMLEKFEKFLKFKQDPLNVKCTKFKKISKGKKSKAASSSTLGGQEAPSKRKMKENTYPSTAQCFCCSEIAHYKRNCPKIKEDEKDGNVASPSDLRLFRYHVMYLTVNPYSCIDLLGKHNHGQP